MLSISDHDFWVKQPSQHGRDDLKSASSGSEKRTVESEGHEQVDYLQSPDRSPLKINEEERVALR